ncbi:hypothetical protein EDB89DRAFT_1259824 [Lactarius sanguifluus]|nr:hypothetical protein EDB89DRAFT_1259824 [Lactarius sanguifluus]
MGPVANLQCYSNKLPLVTLVIRLFGLFCMRTASSASSKRNCKPRSTRATSIATLATRHLHIQTTILSRSSP